MNARKRLKNWFRHAHRDTPLTMVGVGLKRYAQQLAARVNPGVVATPNDREVAATARRWLANKGINPVVTLPDGTRAQSTEQPGARNEV